MNLIASNKRTKLLHSFSLKSLKRFTNVIFKTVYLWCLKEVVRILSTNATMPQVQRFSTLHDLNFSIFQNGWTKIQPYKTPVDLMVVWWWFQMVNSIFQQINKSCLHYPYSVEFYVYIRRIHFNGLAMMLRFSIFTTRRNIYMLYWMHLRYVDLYFLFSWRNIHYSQFACFSKTFWCVTPLETIQQ